MRNGWLRGIRTCAALQSGVVVLVMLCGCGTSKQLTADAVPEPFELSLRMWTTDGRAAYYEVKRDGMLRFSGGKAAWGRTAVDVGPLSEAQRLGLWQVIHRHRLLDADGSWLAKGEQVTYSVNLTAGGAVRSYQAGDEAVPGTKQLNDLLFGYQSQMRYGQVLRPIEIEIEKRKREREVE
jgi:hypothetical protein